ncbi:non-homologous end-joining DNA ligase [Iamia majanohamensis]
MLATLVDEVVTGDGWVFERKLDGIRLVVVRDGERVRLLTRNQLDRTARYPELEEALAAQPCDRFVADAEVVAFDGATTSFSRLQQRSGLAGTEALDSGVAVRLYLFDLMHLDGEDLVDRPLRERKALLRDALDFEDPLRFCAHRNADGAAYLDEACRKGWEGLIAKRADSRYRTGRGREWLKLKCVARQEVVIGGWTDPKGSRNGLGALLVGYHDDEGALRYAGRVGTGFDDTLLQELSDQLGRRARSTSPFAAAPDGSDVHWATPDLVCEVGFTEWTRGGRLRHPRFLGLREDKDPADVVREVPRSAP